MSVFVCVYTIKVKRKPAEGKRKRKEGSCEEEESSLEVILGSCQLYICVNGLASNL